MAELTLEQILGNPEGLSGAAGMLQEAEPRQRRALFGEFFEQAMPFLAPPGVMEAMEGKEPTMRELMLLGVLGPLGGKGKKGLRLLQGGRKEGTRTFEGEVFRQQRRKGAGAQSDFRLARAERLAKPPDVPPEALALVRRRASVNGFSEADADKAARIAGDILNNPDAPSLHRKMAKQLLEAEELSVHDFLVDLGLPAPKKIKPGRIPDDLQFEGALSRQQPLKTIGRSHTDIARDLIKRGMEGGGINVKGSDNELLGLILEFDEAVASVVARVTRKVKTGPSAKQSEKTLSRLRKKIDSFDETGPKGEEEIFRDLMTDVQSRAKQAATKAAKHKWSVNMKDRVQTAQGVKNNEPPWEVFGRFIKKKGLSPKSDPRAGKFIHEPDVPYLRVRRGGEETVIPEWAVVRRLTGPEG
jgi:hypothetical protein